MKLKDFVAIRISDRKRSKTFRYRANLMKWIVRNWKPETPFMILITEYE